MDNKDYLHKFMDKPNSIVDRLLFLMDGRDKYPWGQSIGLGKGVIDGMTRTGSIPGGETLVAIRKCENARIDWILDGTGEPFITSKVLNDEDAIELLDELLAEQWCLYVLSHGVRLAVVLTRPGKFEVKDGKDGEGKQQYKWIDYTIVEVIVGIFGVKANTYLSNLAQTTKMHLVKLSNEQMTSLEKGKIGTYHLCGADSGLLRNSSQVTSDDLVFKHVGQQTLFTSSEEALLDSYRAITTDEQKAVTQIIQSMAKPRRMR
jgi:hypothetical protein